MNSTLKSLLFWMVLVVVAVLIWNFSQAIRPGPSTIPFTDFIARVSEGKVLSVEITGNEIKGTLTGTAGNGNEQFRTYAPTQYEGLGNMLADKGVVINAKPEAASPWTAL